MNESFCAAFFVSFTHRIWYHCPHFEQDTHQVRELGLFMVQIPRGQTFLPSFAMLFSLSGQIIAPELASVDTSDPTTLMACNKDTGEKSWLQKWTRGVWFCVSGSRHIQMWQPLYQWVFYCDLLSLASLS